MVKEKSKEKKVYSEKKQRAIAFKVLLNNGVPPKEICKKLKVSRPLVSYWKTHEIKETHYRKKKLPMKYIKKLISLAKDQPCSNVSSRKLERIINKELKKDKVLIIKEKS